MPTPEAAGSGVSEAPVLTLKRAAVPPRLPRPPTRPPPSARGRLSLALACLCLQCPSVGSFATHAVGLANEPKEGLVPNLLQEPLIDGVRQSRELGGACANSKSSRSEGGGEGGRAATALSVVFREWPPSFGAVRPATASKFPTSLYPESSVSFNKLFGAPPLRSMLCGRGRASWRGAEASPALQRRSWVREGGP